MHRFLLSVALLLLCPLVARAQCPPDTVQCLGAPTVTSEPGYSCIGPWTADQPCFGACYDLPHGEIAILGGGVIFPWTYSVATEDEYWIAGPASSSPISCNARLHSKITTQSGIDGHMTFGEIGGIEHFGGIGGGGSLEEYLYVPLHRLPGESFRIHAGISISSPGIPSADIRARLEFVDVPAGWTIASCQGYSLPTPTASSTWGQMKARYR